MASSGAAPVMFPGFGICPVAVDVYLDGYAGARWDTAPFRHRTGWLMVSEARMILPFGTWRRPLIAAITDHGELYDPWIAERLLAMPVSLPSDAEDQPPEALAVAIDALYWDFLGSMDLANLRHLHGAEEEASRKIEAQEARCEALEKRLWAGIRELRAERRRDDLSDERRVDIEARLKRMLELPDELAHGQRQTALRLREETELLENDVLAALTDNGEIAHHFTIRWRARSGIARRGDIFLPTLSRWPALTHHPWDNQTGGTSLEKIAGMRVFAQEHDE